MDYYQACDVLDLPHDATGEEISRQAEKKRADLEKRVAGAPTMALKAKYRAELARVETATGVLTASQEDDDDLMDLPVSQKQGDADDPEDDPPPAARQAAAPAPGRRPPTREDSGSAAPAPSGRKPPSRESRADEEPAPARPSKKPERQERQERKKAAPAVHEEDDTGEQESTWQPARQGGGLKKGLIVAASILCLLGATTYAGWRWWYQPRVQQANLAQAMTLLEALPDQISRIPDAKSRNETFAWVATAFGNSGNRNAAENLIGKAVTSLPEIPAGSIRQQQECRLCVAQASAGNVQGALERLNAVVEARRKDAAPSGAGGESLQPASGGNPPAGQRVPIWEDGALKGIATALARQGNINEARAVIDRISDKQRACEAMLAVATAVAATDKSAATTFLQATEERAKGIPDPVEKAELLCLVADRTIAIGSKRDNSLKFAKEAISQAASGGSFGNSRTSDAVVLSQARTLRSLWKAKDKETFKKRIVEITGTASNLYLAGSSTQMPDSVGRARVYSAIALAWNDAGDEKQAAKLIEEAISSAKSARAPVSNPQADDYFRQKALVAVVAALAEMENFEGALEHFSSLSLPDEVASAAEALAYWYGRAGQVEQATDLAARVPEGEGRCRCIVALQYGLRNVELETWW